MHFWITSLLLCMSMVEEVKRKFGFQRSAFMQRYSMLPMNLGRIAMVIAFDNVELNFQPATLMRLSYAVRVCFLGRFPE